MYTQSNVIKDIQYSSEKSTTWPLSEQEELAEMSSQTLTLAVTCRKWQHQPHALFSFNVIPLACYH